MPLLNQLFDLIIQGAEYEFVRWIAVSVIVSLASLVVGEKVFHKLQARKEEIYFLVSVFIVVFLILVVVGARPQRPEFVGGIQSVVTGGMNNDKDTVAVITMSVFNTGTMQSVTAGWSVEAVVDGITYKPVFAPMPPGFTFNLPDKGAGTPQSMTYHNADDLLEKSMNPIQPGSLEAGLLFVIFQDIKPEVFDKGADFVVNYSDVLGKKYMATLQMTAKMGDLPLVPGLHTDLVCRPPASSPISNPVSTPALPPEPQPPVKASDVH